MATAHALGVNDHDDIVGDAQTRQLKKLSIEPEDIEEHIWPVLWFRGMETPYRLPGRGDGRAFAINNRGEIVGTPSSFWRPDTHKQMHRDERKDPKREKATRFEPVKINNQGTVLGNEFNQPGPFGFRTTKRAWCYQKNQWSPLPTPPEAVGGASDLNDEGTIVGWLRLAKPASRPYIWREGKGEFLSDQEGAAFAINNKGAIVGWQNKRGSPCLWKDSKCLALETLLPPTSGWVLYDAVGINDNGQIIGHGALKGKRYGYLLTP